MANFPAEFLYTKEHEWASYDEAAGVVTIGITSYAAEKLGEIVYVELPDEGTALEREESFGIVESTKSVSDLFSPVTGEVVEANDVLMDGPELINNDPHDEGWLVRVKVSDPAELEELMDAEAYESFVGDLEED